MNAYSEFECLLESERCEFEERRKGLNAMMIGGGLIADATSMPRLKNREVRCGREDDDYARVVVDDEDKGAVETRKGEGGA